MERLTKRLDNGRVIICGNKEATTVEQSEQNFNRARVCLDRLAAYEDTGLMPEEIRNLAERKKMGDWWRI